MIDVMAILMGAIILLPIIIGFLLMIFKDDDTDSTHQSID
jgi:hypothetical protein